MRNQLWILTLLLFLTLTGCQDRHDNNGEEASGVFVKDVVEHLNREVPELQKEQHVPAVGVGLIDGGKVVSARVYGEHQLGHPAPDNAIFNVASIAKTVTAMTVLRLVDEGLWSLDEPLAKYWIDPDLVDDSLLTHLTTRHVLTQTTGFKNWRNMSDSGKLAFDFVPGTSYQYSGEGMEYLRKAVEGKFGKDWGRLTDSLLFEPLRLRDATLNWISDNDTVRFAKWYDGEGKEYTTADYRTSDASAADDLLITVRDLADFGIAVMDTVLLSGELYEEMVEPQIAIHGNASQGLGWTVINNLPGDAYALNHDGGDIGVAATLILLPKTRSGVIVLANGDNGRTICNAVVKSVLPFGRQLVQKLYWGGEIPSVITIDTAILNTYAGTYKTNQGTELSFLPRDNALKISGVGVPGVEIYPRSQTEFFPTDFEVFFEFTATAEGVTFRLMSQGKDILNGTRL